MRYFYFLIAIFVFTSCEDVVELPLTEGPTRLVIDANINWEKGTAGSEQVIRLTKTVGFYETEIPPANGAQVVIKNSNSDEFEFFEDGTTGLYKTLNFVPVIGETYTLEITYEGKTFTASETLKPITNIKGVRQKVENIFGRDVIRVDFDYTDPINQENYYLGEFSSNAYLLNVYRTWSDEIINGNDDSVFEIDENLEKGKELTLRFYGVSEAYHNYIALLLQQIESNGPFATPPSELKGNCVNTNHPDDPDKKPLGYFRLSEFVTETYIIE